MKRHPLAAYFILLIVLCSSVIVGARLLGRQGTYLAQVYMLTPAMAALLTRLFFYRPRFRDANLRFGRIRHYFIFWAISVGITMFSYLMFTLLGGISWDFTGQIFLDRLAQQFELAGQDMYAALPPGFTPRTMLVIYFIGGLTVFNILPGIIAGFGEEFGHRGFMFPMLYRIRPWVGILVGGLIWFAWHMPLALVIPQTAGFTTGQTLLNLLVLAGGSICTFIYLSYVYVRTQSVWVTSLAHIALNNAAASFSYFSVLQNQLSANIGLSLSMLILVLILYSRRELQVFREYFGQEDGSRPEAGYHSAMSARR